MLPRKQNKNPYLTLGSICIETEVDVRVISWPGDVGPSWLELFISISKSDCGTGTGPSSASVVSKLMIEIVKGFKQNKSTTHKHCV